MEKSKDNKMGYVYAMQAFFAWGILPIFWKLLSHVSAFEILAHRIFWSFIFLAFFLFWTRQSKLLNLLKQKKTRNSLITSSLLIGVNWGFFIYAVNTNQIVEASLGYYINPIANVFLGILVLNEKLDKLKFAALLLASTAVIYLTIDYGKFPWISILLACTFALYGLVKKTAGIDAIPALCIETLLLTPLAFVFIIYKIWIGTSAFFAGNFLTDIYLILTGIVTSFPLYWFAKGAQRIPLSALGFMQYIGPSLMLLIGVLIYKEKFRHEQAIAFGMIWCALFLYTFSMIRNTKRILKSKVN
ncbi:EamA family transporter RarD [Labilibaculum sp.]|uniref:EamA family transporter RarD n=1 Tax=Labilibaculum sp. TaxID=2060723 RepID=UPI00356995FD